MSIVLAEEMRHLAERLGRSAFKILETGAIRHTEEEYHVNDGWSTLTFAEHVATSGGHLTSIDLDITPSHTVLAAHGLREYVRLMHAYSIEAMAALIKNGECDFDLIFLDSDNDAELILHEYFIAQHMINRPGLILVDDVDLDTPDVKKGDDLIPYLETHHIAYRMLERTGDGLKTGVLAIDMDA